MKKLLLLLLVVSFAFQVSAKLKNKDLIGKWKYEVNTGSEIMKGVFKFVENEGNLTGEIQTDDGYTLPFTKIEIKEENSLYLEVKTDYEIIKISVKVEKDAFSGMGSNSQGDAPITGKKVEE